MRWLQPFGPCSTGAQVASFSECLVSFFFWFILVSFGASCSRVAQCALSLFYAQVAFSQYLCASCFFMHTRSGLLCSISEQVASHSSSAVTNKHTHTETWFCDSSVHPLDRTGLGNVGQAFLQNCLIICVYLYHLVQLSGDIV